MNVHACVFRHEFARVFVCAGGPPVCFCRTRPVSCMSVQQRLTRGRSMLTATCLHPFAFSSLPATHSCAEIASLAAGPCWKSV